MKHAYLITIAIVQTCMNIYPLCCLPSMSIGGILFVFVLVLCVYGVVLTPLDIGDSVWLFREALSFMVVNRCRPAGAHHWPYTGL